MYLDSIRVKENGMAKSVQSTVQKKKIVKDEIKKKLLFVCVYFSLAAVLVCS